MTQIKLQFARYDPTNETLPLAASPFESIDDVDQANELIEQALDGVPDDTGWHVSDAAGEVFQVREI